MVRKKEKLSVCRKRKHIYSIGFYRRFVYDGDNIGPKFENKKGGNMALYMWDKYDNVLFMRVLFIKVNFRVSHAKKCARR